MQEHRTTDTGELAPHPGMTSDDLRDFERWADQVDRDGTGGALLLIILVTVLVAGLLA